MAIMADIGAISREEIPRSVLTTACPRISTKRLKETVCCCSERK
jgi:hypothetical protein